MRQKKKFKLFLIITTICAISLFKTIESIRVPTDWSELTPTKSSQQKYKLPKQKVVYGYPKYHYSGQTNSHKSQKPIVRYSKNSQRPNYNNPVYYKNIPLNTGKQNYYAPKRATVDGQRLNQPSRGWVPLTVINQQYNLAPLVANNQNSYQNIPNLRDTNTFQHGTAIRSGNSYQNQPILRDTNTFQQDTAIRSGNSYPKQPYIWIPYQKTQVKSFKTPPPLPQENIRSPVISLKQPEALKQESTEENANESFETAEPPTRIPNFAEKIYANDPFSRDYVKKDGLESRSDDQEEDPEKYEVPQEETPISEHEVPLDIPTKPIYPGEGEWAKPGRKYRVFNRPEIPSKEIEQEQEQPDGYEIFENGQERFKQAQSKYERRHEDLADKFKVEDEDGNESEPLYEKPEIGFVPLKTYAQVRKSETTRHLPQSEAYKEAASEEELINAPRLREVIKNTRAHTVYTEEGYEDEAYDHAGKEKKAEENDGYVNLEDDFEDYKEKRKKGKKASYDERGHNVGGVDDESRKSHEDTKDLDEDHGLSEEYLHVERDSNSSGTEFKQTKQKPRTNRRKGRKDTSWKKSEMMKDIKETKVKDMHDGIINMEVKKEISLIRNPGTRGAQKYKQIQTERISQTVKPMLMKNFVKETLSTTSRSTTEFQDILTTEVIPTDNKDSKVLDEVNNAFAKISEDSDVVSTQKPPLDENKSKLRKRIVKKIKISEINGPTGPTLSRVKRYDREKLSKIYIRKRPKYYWERSKNRGNMRVEFNKTTEKIITNQTATKGIKEPIPVIKPISKLAYKNRPKRDLFQIDHPKLNIDKLTYDIVDVSKIKLPTPKSDLTFVKYPYYLMAESGRINKHSPLKYAEDMRNIPEKSEGGMEFYESKSSIQCPEVETNVEPIPDRIKNKNGEENNDSNEEDNIDEKVQPVQQIQRLKGLGDKIDCMKIKYFGENPLDSPFFKEEIIEAPSMESVFPHKLKKQIFKKQPVKANLNFEETREQISYIQQIGKTTEAPKLQNTEELINNIKVIAGYLNENAKNSSKKIQKRETTSIDTDHSFKLDTIVVLNEESNPNDDGEISEMKKLVILSKTEKYTPEATTERLTSEDQSTINEPLNEATTEEQKLAMEHRSLGDDLVLDVSPPEDKQRLSNESNIPKYSELILTTTENQKYVKTTRAPFTTAESATTTKRVSPKRRRRPFVSTLPPTEPKSHYSEQHPEDFLIIIDTGGESLSDIPLQLPLVNNKEFGKTFDINKYLPHTDLKSPKQNYNIETNSFETKKPNHVQMEVFADILQHMKNANNIQQKSVVADETMEKPVVNESDQKREPIKRKIRKPNRKMRMKVTNSSLPPPGQETIFSKPEPVYNDQPTSETEHYSVYNDQPTSGTEHHTVREALEVADLNRPNLKLKYPGTYKTLYLEDKDETNRDVFTPENYEDTPEYSSDPDHPETNYEYPPFISDEFREIGNPNDESFTSKYSVHEVDNGNSLQYDLVFNRVHNTYLLRPVKYNQIHHPQYNSGYHPIPNYTPEFRPIIDNQVEEILVKGLKPVRYQNGLKLVIPHAQMPKQFAEQFQTLAIRPVRKLKPLKVIRLAVKPKKVLRITTKQPVRLVAPQQVPIPIPLTFPHRFAYHKHNLQHTDYYNIRGMVPPLITEHSIGYSNYQPITFAHNNHLAYDSLADENTNLLSRKSFGDLQMESSDRMETIVDFNGQPIPSTQRKYTEVDQYNRQANKYKKTENIEPMKGEVILSSKDSDGSSSINLETDANLTEQRTEESLKDSYGNIVDKPTLNAYSAVVIEMAKESKKYINESHEPNMSIENKTEVVQVETSTIITIDNRRGEPKYETKVPNQRIRFPSTEKTDLPVTNRRRYKSTTSSPELAIFKAVNTPELFDINQYIPDSKLMRELRKNNTLFTRRKYSNLKPETAESQPRHSYSSRFNSADEQLPLPTEKTLQKPVVLVIEQIIKPNNNSKPQTLQSIRKNRYQKTRKNQDAATTTTTEKSTTTTQRIVSFRRVRPIPIVRTSSSIVTSDITESTIRKTNRPRNTQFSKSSKMSEPIDHKEHIINRSRVNKTIRTNINTTPRQKLVVDPVALRHKARQEAQVEAMEKVKEKLESNVDKNLDTPSSMEEDSKTTDENPSNNRHYEKNEHRHTSSEIIHTKIYTPENDEDEFENDPEKDDEDEDNEHDETLSKDFSEQVEIIGNLEQIRNGPKHGGNYRHINDQKSDDTNHDDRRNGEVVFEAEDDPDDEDSGNYASYDRDFSESKITEKDDNPDESAADDFTSTFYSDPNLPKKINNLKHDDLSEDHSTVSPSKLVQLDKEQNKPIAYWSKVIKDPGMRQYFYVRE